jgi:hypothetical protein
MDQNSVNSKKTSSESLEKSKSSKALDITDDVIGGSPAGGVAGTGGVSTNDVGLSRTSKNPLTER